MTGRNPPTVCRIMIALLLVGSSLSASARQEWPDLADGLGARVPLQADGGVPVFLRLAPRDARLVVSVAGTEQTLVIADLVDMDPSGRPEFSLPRPPLVAADFNFDGFVDLWLPAGIGYAGTNYFYDIFIFDPETSRFVPLDFEAGYQLCNPEPDSSRQAVISECKDGPGYLRMEIRFAAGRPYLARYAGMPAYLFWSYDQRGYVRTAASYDAAGTLLYTQLVEYEPGDSRQAAVRTVERPYVDLRAAPAEDAQVLGRIDRGERVELLESLTDDVYRIEWLRVRRLRPSGGAVEGWIRP